ncbi:L-type lectin-domain containing receptor kinase V.9-like [Actinidia eriantha]|uniref:L-type lectin-domain containing receptor kinase V.9-like n=1 Tax=Actinidia eriantha TaxID=165200 RepID=UPI0025850CDA|nr:L-type lectin-domain containing receptor kinase V.9-like [Actinidia eriantha]
MAYRMIMIFSLLVQIGTSTNNIPDDFMFNIEDFNGYLKLGGTAELGSDGLFTLNNSSRQQSGHAFYNFPIYFENSTNGSFSTSFIFAIVPEFRHLSGHGLAFVISPINELPGSILSQYLGLFNAKNIGLSSNHILAVELDTSQSPEFNDINDNHVGIDINSLISIKSAPAGYFADKTGAFNNLSLASGNPMQVWVEYDGIHWQFNVTLSPINKPKPKQPLLSLALDLSPILLDYMYVGFSSSTGAFSTNHYILGWSFKLDGPAPQIDLSRLPKLPRNRQQNEDKHIKRILAIILPLISFLVLVVIIFGAFAMSRMKKIMEVLEDWEVQFGPHRFNYKDLFIATKGFKDKVLLGRGGFGRVYHGVLPTSNIQVAVKRVSHDSRQGMREFVAEIATIGRLRHPNLVRLLGYCRRKQELLLVYDFMPNGSLEKYLYGQLKGTLNWTQRFKIIRDVASGLFYLHQQWVQVIIHRDIKASNILIDKEFNGRLGDFGLAKLCDHGIDPQTSHVAGTLGYIAPEMARTGKASTSTDLFAFGVFMLEVVCGRRPVEPRASPDEVILIDWVFECLERENIFEAIDQQLGAEYVVEEAELILKLGLLCSHTIAAARPSMSTVVQYLEGEAQLPAEDLIDIIKSRDFSEAPKEQAVLPISIPPITISEPFISRGR